jgi:predicted acylesterase/phospholipase RssA
MSLPVAPSSYIYSHFKHVSGTPAPEGTRGVAITKLKILDTLIEQLSKIKKQDSLALGAPLSDQQADALIEQYKTQIRQAKAASAAIPYIPSPAAQTGAVFSLTA